MPAPATGLHMLRRRRPLDLTKLYALSGFSGTNFFATQAGGGEAGIATGFVTVLLLLPRSYNPAANQMIAHNRSAAGTQGRQTYLMTTSAMNFYAWDGGGTVRIATVTPSPRVFGQITLLLCQHTGVSIRAILDRLTLSGTLALTGHTPNAAPREYLGMVDGLDPANRVDVLGYLTLRGTPSEARIHALYDAVRTLGDVPATFAVPTVGDAPITALAPPHWYRADTVVTSGGSLTSVTNLGSAGGTLLPTGTVAAPAADALFDNQPTIALDGVNNYLSSSLAASAWRFLHDGTGAEMFMVFVPVALPTNQVFLATGAAGNGVGAALYASNSLLTYLIQNGTGSTAILTNLGTLAVGAQTYTDSSFGLSQSPDMINRLRSYPVSPGADILLTPAAGDSLSTLRVGANYAGGQRASMRLADLIIFNRVLTADERVTVQNYITTRYGLDRVTLTHRWSLRDELVARKLGQQSGQIAPPSLPDSVTAAGVDAMARAGTPTVTVIDPSIDGRVSYGSLGTSDANYLEAPLGIRGAATGFTLVFAVRYDAAASGSVVLISNYVGTPTGYTIYSNSSQIRIYRAGSGDLVIGTAATADVGVTKLVAVTWDGTTWRTYDQGVAGATSVAGMTPAVLPMTVGTYPTHASGGTGISSLFAIAGCDAALSASEIAAVLATWRATGRISIPSGKPNTRSWDITLDVVANGGAANGMPAQVLDRVGADHLTRTSGFTTVTNGSATGLRGFTTSTNFLGTPNGIAGTAAGFWASVMFTPNTLTGVRILFGRSNHTLGWSISMNGAYVVVYVTDGAGLQQQGPQLNIGAPYLGTLIHLSFTFSGGVITGYLNGTQYASPVSITGYTASTTSMVIGATNSGALYGATGCDIFGAAGGHFVPTAGEIATASADSLSSGSIAAVPAKTSHRYDLKADIATAGGVPTRALERVSGVDNMSVLNAKLEVAQRVERVWSYEATPILYGARDFTLADYYECPTGLGESNAQSFWCASLFVVTSQATSKTRVLFGSLGPNTATGFEIRTVATNSAVYFLAADNGGTARTAPSSTIAATDVGKLLLYVGVWDAASSKMRGYFKRIEQSTGTVVTGYAPASTGLRIGRDFLSNDYGVTDTIVLGTAAGLGAPTLAQVQAFFDETMATERIGSIASMTSLRLDLTADALGNANTLPAVLTNRGSGSFTFTRTGALTTAPHYSRAWSW